MENPDRAPEASTASTINTPRVVSERTYDHKYVYVGKNAEKWEQHRVACGGCSQPTFAAHLLSLHEKHCPRNPSQSLGVKLEVDDPMEGEGSVGAEKDKIRISLDGDLARQWRHLQTLAGYEAAEMEYLCWLMNIAEQMLGWKGPPSTTVGDNFDNNEDSSGMLAQNMPMDVPTPGTSTDDSSYTRFKPRRLPEYQIQTPTQDTDMDQDVKPDIVPAAAATSTDTSAQGSLTKFTLDWGKKPSATAPPTSVETDTTSLRGKQVTSISQHPSTATVEDTLRSEDSTDQKYTLERKSDEVSDSTDIQEESSEDENQETLEDKEDESSDSQETLSQLSESSTTVDDSYNDSDHSWSGKETIAKKTTVKRALKVKRLPMVKSSKKNSSKAANGSKGKTHRKRLVRSMKKVEKSGTMRKEKILEKSDAEKLPTEEGSDKKPPKKKRLRPNQKAFVKSDRFCLICRRYYPEQYAFDMHCYKLHGGKLPEKKELCVFCGDVFGTKPILRSHMRNIHENPQRVTCTVCGKQIQKRSYIKHMNQVHGKDRYCCDICGRILKNKASLRSHRLASHLQVGSQPCTWPDCGKTFNTRGHLKTHMLVHTGETPISCKHCDYKCRQISSLSWHMKKRHPNLVTHCEVKGTERSTPTQPESTLTQSDNL